MIKNSKLQNLFKLSSKVTVIVPATININEGIDNAPFVDKVASLMAECFGGATASQTLGYWKSPVVGLVKEKSTTVFAYCSEADLQAHADKVIDLCESLKTEMAQDAIALEINGEMYFL
ncbi:hypothetical protein [Lacrimispora sp.]|uniref:hypothetical protein n=1 Tax=Lacrimispora sp. TaxID=2719234 RepID=UPI0028AE1535|nr:hypothetical protein [Lacrimispora sp.]